MGSWTLYHGPFSLSIRAAGWGKIAVGSSSGKAPSGCCDPRKAGEFGAENNRVRHRFAGVRHRLAEAGEAAFLSCSMMWGYRHREKPLPRPRNPAKPRTKKRDSQRNADHKKRLCPPVRKKPAFLVGLYSWCAWTLRGDRPAPARANWHKSSHIKKSSKHRGLYTTGTFVYHEGITLPLYAGNLKESPL